MRKAKVFVKGVEAGVLTELVHGKEHIFEYYDEYDDGNYSSCFSLELCDDSPFDFGTYKDPEFLQIQREIEQIKSQEDWKIHIERGYDCV